MRSPTLLDMASVGEALTYDPASASAVLAGIGDMRTQACYEVNTNITGLDDAVRTQLRTQLC